MNRYQIEEQKKDDVFMQYRVIDILEEKVLLITTSQSLALNHLKLLIKESLDAN